MTDPSLRLPPLNALRAFDAAARHRNFRIAAEELGVTQGAVAQQVRHLEATLGVTLFERRPRTLMPTAAGQAYAGRIRHALELIAEATAELRPAPLRLTISVTPTFASKWLIPRLPGFTAAHPGVDLRVLAAESLSNFQTDGVDIAVRQGKPPFGPGLTADLLFEQDVVPVCGPTLLSGASLPLAPEELRRFVLLHDAHDLWPEFIETALAGADAAAARGIRFSHTALALDAALAGQGIALVSRFLVEPDLAAGRLVRPFDATMRGPLGFHVVMPRRPRHPEPTGALRDWLLENAGKPLE